MTEELLRATTARICPDPDDMIETYRSARPDATPVELFVAIQSDWFCIAPSDRLVEARLQTGNPVHSFEFAWQPSTYDGRLGACHTLEIPFVFDTLSDPWGSELRGADAPQSLADDVHAAWVSFVTSGDPGWPAYGERRLVRRLDVESSTVEDPRRSARAAWSGLDF